MSDTQSYWWSRYGDFSPGMGIYPHVGEVITCYRLKRGFRTQQDLAIALGVSKRTVEELEGTVNLNTPDSIERRQIIAQLLRIPPALLALDWRFMVYGQNTEEQKDTFADIVQLLEDDTFTLYQNILRMGRGYLYNGGPGYIADIVDESLDKLLPIARNMPTAEQEPWQEMVCRYYLLSTSFALRRMDKKQTLMYARRAIEIAGKLENVELIASAHYRRVRVHLDLRKAETSEDERRKHLEHAKKDVQIALDHAEQIGPILRGKLYLIAAEVSALDAHDPSARKQCEKWQEKAATLVYRSAQDEDDTFLRLNATALHHEKAKTLIHFGRLREAHSELVTARKTLLPDSLTWHVNLYLTEANLYKAQKDLEASAASAIEAYKLAKVIQSLKDELEVKKIFSGLQKLDATNPYVCNLGMMLGMY
ncbi:MAG: helix-turn-helix domain-containing protein [Ktedonobacteraceae bacterium]